MSKFSSTVSMSRAGQDPEDSNYELVVPAPPVYSNKPPISLHKLYGTVNPPSPPSAPYYKRPSFPMEKHPGAPTSPPITRTRLPSLTGSHKPHRLSYQNITVEELSRSGSPNGISLEEFSTIYANSLPLRVHVTKGVFGDNEESTISTDDEYDVHFVRHREVVRVKQNKEEFSVPPNSMIKFGLLYDPNCSEQEALRGFNFPRVSDILAMTTRPKLVCATKAWESKYSKVSLKAMEVLLIKEAYSTDSGQKLRTYSFTDHCDKNLEVFAEGHFSTKPLNVQLHLSEILRFVPKPIPSSVVLYGTDETSGNVPTHLLSRVLQMTRNYTEVVLIVTSVTNEVNIKDHAPFEIPTDVDVELRVGLLSDKEQLELTSKYEYLKDKIRHKQVRHYRYTNVSEQAYQTQQEIFATVQTDYQNVGRTNSERDYHQANSDTRLSIGQRLNLLEKRAQRTEEEIASFISNSDVIKANHDELEAKLSKQTDQLATAQTEIEANRDELEAQLSEQTHQLATTQTKIKANRDELEVKLSEQTHQLATAQTEIKANCDELEVKLSEQTQQLATARTEIARLNKEVEQMKQNQASKEYLNPRPTPQTYGLSSEGAAEENKMIFASLDHNQVLYIIILFFLVWVSIWGGGLLLHRQRSMKNVTLKLFRIHFTAGPRATPVFWFEPISRVVYT